MRWRARLWKCIGRQRFKRMIGAVEYKLCTGCHPYNAAALCLSFGHRHWSRKAIAIDRCNSYSRTFRKKGLGFTYQVTVTILFPTFEMREELAHLFLHLLDCEILTGVFVYLAGELCTVVNHLLHSHILCELTVLVGVSRKSVGIRIQVSDTEKEELLVSNTSEISPE